MMKKEIKRLWEKSSGGEITAMLKRYWRGREKVQDQLFMEAKKIFKAGGNH